jgi:hypothetical protein
MSLLRDKVEAKGVLVTSSGATEKNIDTVIGRRFKKKGMSWITEGANNLVKMRILWYNNATKGNKSPWEV